MKFGVDVGEYIKKVEKEIDDLRRSVIIELFSSIIEDSPVDTGRLRGNWQITANNPASGVLEVTDPDGQSSIAKVQDFAEKKRLGKDGVAVLTNNLPYAYRIEYDGWSKQAPRGMVRKNAIRVSQNLKTGGL